MDVTSSIVWSEGTSSNYVNTINSYHARQTDKIPFVQAKRHQYSKWKHSKMRIVLFLVLCFLVLSTSRGKWISFVDFFEMHRLNMANLIDVKSNCPPGYAQIVPGDCREVYWSVSWCCWDFYLGLECFLLFC